MVRRPASLLIFALALAALPATWSHEAHASSALALDVETLTQKSAAVVHATVAEQRFQESEDGSAIVTLSRLVVRSFLSGEAPQQLWVRQFGGTYRGKVQKVSGDASIRPGDNVVAFLRPGKDVYHFTALGLSVFHVNAGLARRNTNGLHLVRSEGGRIVPASENFESALPLVDLEARVRAARNTVNATSPAVAQ